MSGNSERERVSRYIESLDFQDDTNMETNVRNLWRDLLETSDEDVLTLYVMLSGREWMGNEKLSRQITSMLLIPLVLEVMEDRGMTVE